MPATAAFASHCRRELPGDVTAIRVVNTVAFGRENEERLVEVREINPPQMARVGLAASLSPSEGERVG